MMFRKIVKATIAGIALCFMSSCDKLDEQHKDTIENRLVQSFREERPEVRERVSEIVRAAEEQDYQGALNKLALLSATTKLDRKQKYAVDAVMKQLRYDMEEKIFSEQKSQERQGE